MSKLAHHSSEDATPGTAKSFPYSVSLVEHERHSLNAGSNSDSSTDETDDSTSDGSYHLSSVRNLARDILNNINPILYSSDKPQTRPSPSLTAAQTIQQQIEQSRPCLISLQEVEQADSPPSVSPHAAADLEHHESTEMNLQSGIGSADPKLDFQHNVWGNWDYVATEEPNVCSKLPSQEDVGPDLNKLFVKTDTEHLFVSSLPRTQLQDVVVGAATLFERNGKYSLNLFFSNSNVQWV